MKIKIKNKISAGAIITGAILVLYTVIMVFFIYWALMTSVKTNDDIVIAKNYLGLPKTLTGDSLTPWEWEWENFATIIQFFDVENVFRNGKMILSIPFGTQAIYTVLYACGCAFFGTLIPCIVAYATSKFNYKFNAILDGICIVSMIIPIVGSQISMVSLLNKLNIYDSFIGLYLMKSHYANMYYLMFAAIFRGVSKEYYDAAYIDGANEFSVMTKIAMPLVSTSFGLIFLMFFIQYWNDYTTLLLFAPSHPTISYGLFRVMTLPSGGTARGYMTVRMAGCVIIVMPVIVVFLIFRNKIMGNLTIGGVKE